MSTLRLVHITTRDMADIEDIDAGSESPTQLPGGEDRPLLLVPAGIAVPSKKPKHLAPQQAVDDFWAIFNTKNSGKGNRFQNQ
jgi:hypothetical protein